MNRIEIAKALACIENKIFEEKRGSLYFFFGHGEVVIVSSDEIRWTSGCSGFPWRQARADSFEEARAFVRKLQRAIEIAEEAEECT